jgi:hypothetical protein
LAVHGIEDGDARDCDRCRLGSHRGSPGESSYGNDPQSVPPQFSHHLGDPPAEGTITIGNEERFNARFNGQRRGAACSPPNPVILYPRSGSQAYW